MKIPDNESLSDRVTLFGLLFACPYDQGNDVGCQMHAIRKLAPRERVAWLCRLSREDALAALKVHRNCLCWKETHVGLTPPNEVFPPSTPSPVAKIFEAPSTVP